MTDTLWRRAHPWQAATQNFDFNSRRRMAQRGLLANYVERVDVYVIFERQGGCCASCGRETAFYTQPGDKQRLDLAHFDHRFPICWGGRHEMANIQMLCQGCHIEKSKIKYGTRKSSVA